MKTYKEFQEDIFNWLYGKHKSNPSFTFSLRMKANKGSETNYFIGTEKAKYFATTFWNIPIGYPGSASDLIDLIFQLKGTGYSYYFYFNQTKSPDSKQNQYALDFIRQVKPIIKSQFKNYRENTPEGKMENFTFSPDTIFSSIESLISHVEQDLERVIQLVSDELTKFKDLYPDFKAHRFTQNEFDELYQKLQKRKIKYITEQGGAIEKQKVSIPIETIEKKFPKVPGSNPPLNQILFGPPGTGKTYNTINKAIAIANPNFDLKQPRKKIKEEFERLMKEGQVVFTTFHQSMNYEDFIEGIKPLKPNQVDTHLKYDVLPGIFKKVCQDAKTPNLVGFDSAFEKLKEELTTTELLSLKTPTGKEFSVSLNSNDNLTLHTGQDKEKQGTLTKENIQKQINGEEKFKGWEGYFKGVINYLKTKYKYSENESVVGKNYVLIIDEINRGNVSQIFGELITLIEEDKRLGKDEALEVILPYSKDKFGVPSNLYIIGTMNTADRSVEAIDTALRRRFSFEEVPPKYDLDELQYEFAGVKGFEILQNLNKRIEKLLDKDHQIGHSYFMKKNGNDVKEILLTSFYKNIIPLLQEYFFGDFGKIGLVLGQGFVQKKEWNKDSDSFAEFDYESASEFDDRPVYEIIDHRDNDQADDSFVNAIKTLMNKKIG
jgi:5-methylcytosine-specific restriction protein B